MAAAVEALRSGPGLTLLTGANGSGKSTAARAFAGAAARAELLSAESQQAFYEAELARDESNFQEATDAGTTVGALLGEAARTHALTEAFRLAPLWHRGYRALSTGEGRKALLLAALLREPELLVLDDPFEGLDVAACRDLARAIVEASAQASVLVAGAFEPSRVPFPPAAIGEVIVVARGAVAFRGAFDAWSRVAGASRRVHAPPPVDLGSFYAPLDPGVPLVDLVRGRVAYGEEVVFECLDFRVVPGQHTLIQGPNGSGKSTLLEMVSGDHPQAYANDLHLFGRRRGTGETVWDIKKNVGVVSSRLHRDYRVAGSVEEVLLSGLFDSIGVYVAPEPSHRARARAWLAWLDLGLEPGAPFRDLSFGQQRLVLIARAAIKVPPLVILDEPTAGLDDDNRRRVLELVASLCTQEKSTVLFVTHRDDERAFWDARIGGARLDLGAARALSRGS
jgi:molybdate transport system ATP-binding protein